MEEDGDIPRSSDSSDDSADDTVHEEVRLIEPDPAKIDFEFKKIGKFWKIQFFVFIQCIRKKY